GASTRHDRRHCPREPGVADDRLPGAAGQTGNQQRDPAACPGRRPVARLPAPRAGTGRRCDRAPQLRADRPDAAALRRGRHPEHQPVLLMGAGRDRIGRPLPGDEPPLRHARHRRGQPAHRPTLASPPAVAGRRTAGRIVPARDRPGDLRRPVWAHRARRCGERRPRAGRRRHRQRRRGDGRCPASRRTRPPPHRLPRPTGGRQSQLRPASPRLPRRPRHRGPGADGGPDPGGRHGRGRDRPARPLPGRHGRLRDQRPVRERSDRGAGTHRPPGPGRRLGDGLRQYRGLGRCPGHPHDDGGRQGVPRSARGRVAPLPADLAGRIGDRHLPAAPVDAAHFGRHPERPRGRRRLRRGRAL
ncbi:MAG: Transcriptional regulator, LacI family, partial [uncultured Thermomicrobiales bacterium]